MLFEVYDTDGDKAEVSQGEHGLVCLETFSYGTETFSYGTDHYENSLALWLKPENAIALGEALIAAGKAAQ